MILTKYIFKQTINSVFVSTIVFLSVIWLSQSFKTIQLIIYKGANLSDFFILSAYSLPNWLLIALPFGTFAGCMISYLKFENDKEILVMKAAGISSLKISSPAILVALLSSLLLFAIAHIILPYTYKNFKILQNQIRNNSQELSIKDNVFLDLNENQTIFIGELDDQNYFQEIFIQDRSDKSTLIELYSKNGYLIIKKNTITLYMNEGTRISTDISKNSTILDFNNYNLEIKNNISKLKSNRIVEYNEYNFFDLIKKANENKAKQGKLLAEAHSRNTVSFLPIVFVLIVMITILNSGYSRILSAYKKTFSISFLIIIQSIIILIRNAVHSNISLIPLMYIFPFIIIITSFFILYKNINFTSFFKNNF